MTLVRRRWLRKRTIVSVSKVRIHALLQAERLDDVLLGGVAHAYQGAPDHVAGEPLALQGLVELKRRDDAHLDEDFAYLASCFYRGSHDALCLLRVMP